MLLKNNVASSQNQAGKIQRQVSDFLTSAILTVFFKNTLVWWEQRLLNSQGQAGATGIPQLMCQWPLAIRGRRAVQPCVVRRTSLQRVTSTRISGSHTLCAYSHKHSPEHGVQPQSSCTCCCESSKSNSLKRSKTPGLYLVLQISKETRSEKRESGDEEHITHEAQAWDQRELEGRHPLRDTPQEVTGTQPYTSTRSLTFPFLHPFHVFPHTET